jgi:threonine synthase
MRYISTRGSAPAVGFADILLSGSAPDGGLYMPEAWPKLRNVDRAAWMPFNANTEDLLKHFIGEDIDVADLTEDIEAAYKTFSKNEVIPLKRLGGGRVLLELFHGPTLAFKDVAMQLLGRLIARTLKARNQHATIIAATSGDTGSAAIAALRGLPHVQLIVLHPHGRVSEVQRRQMTTVLDDNVHNIALEGTFDDTQNIVKALFADVAFAKQHALAAVNSINFARIAAQSAYYFNTSAYLMGEGVPSYVVPTGNFGDVFAAEAAARMGVPMKRLVVATNSNDIMARALNEGVYASGSAQPTLSPSMDIQVASNFERALFEASNRDAAWIAKAMAEFAKTRSLTIPRPVLSALRGRYAAASANDAETTAAIKKLYDETGVIVDPHTAVGFAAVEKLAEKLEPPVVYLATAHPAKFPQAVQKAIGKTPELPPQLADLMERKERCTVLPNDVDAVRRFIAGRAKNP